jgi:hypothetical protein
MEDRLPRAAVGQASPHPRQILPSERPRTGSLRSGHVPRSRLRASPVGDTWARIKTGM